MTINGSGRAPSTGGGDAIGVEETPAREGNEAGVPGGASKPFFLRAGKGWEYWLDPPVPLGSGVGETPLRIPPLTTRLGARSAITCSFRLIGPAEDVRVSHFVAGCALCFSTLTRGPEPSCVGEKPPSSFDGGRVVNSWLVEREGSLFP